MNNLKIAFCLIGVVGSCERKYGVGLPIDYRIGYHFNKKHIFDNNDVDVFIHSWSVEFEKELINTYKPKKYIFENQIDFKQNNIRDNSIKSRWYSTMKVTELKTQYEIENNFKYDFVMIYRFDCMFNKNINFEILDNQYFYNAHINECYDNSCQCERMRMYADLWFIGNSNDINLFANLYNKWEEYEIKSPHKVIFHHIHTVGLYDRLKHIFYDRYDNYPIRCKYKNCEYQGEDFDLNRLKEFKNINEGYGERTHK